MAQTSYPFDEQSVTEDQWSAMMSTAQETRVVTGLAVYGDSSGRQVKAPLGTAWVRGHFYQSTAEEVLAIGANASGNPRIDTVVLTLDPTANSIVLAVVAGTAAATPVPPTLTQTTTGVYQHPLADVAVANGAATITANNVTPRTRVATATVGRNIPGRNLLHNGAMQVHQRGTSASGKTTSDYFTVDRWRAALLNLGTWTQSVEADAPTGSGFHKSLKMLCTTADAAPAAADYAFVYQAIEGQNLQSIKKGTADAEPLTLSFWVKSNKTGVYTVFLLDITNSRTVSATYTVASSGTWERQTITFPADLTGALSNVSTGELQVNFGLAYGSDRTSGTLNTTWAAQVTANIAPGQTNLAADTNNYWQITGVQLEVGSASTGFEFKGYEQELSECQRYYQHMEYAAENQFYPFVGDAYDATHLTAIYLPPMNFRAAPTSVAIANLEMQDKYGATSVAITGASILQASRYAPLVAFTVASGLTANTSYWVKTASASQSYIGLSADL